MQAIAASGANSLQNGLFHPDYGSSGDGATGPMVAPENNALNRSMQILYGIFMRRSGVAYDRKSPGRWDAPGLSVAKPDRNHLHERADGSLRILMIHNGLLTLPPWPIPHSATFESRDVLSRSLRKSRRTGRAGLRLPGPADSRHATAPRPFFATSVRSFNDAPRGRFSPRSHWLTSPVVTLR